MMLAQDDCCTSGVCDEDKALAGPKFDFFHHAKRLYVAALGIEILCIAAAEIGENRVFTCLASTPLAFQ
jgi:hypothetical protein